MEAHKENHSMRQGPWSLSVTIHASTQANTAYTNMPAANSFLFNSHRHIVMLDMEGFSMIRLKVNTQGTAGFSGSKLTLRYAKTFSTNVNNYTDVGVSEVSVPIDVANGYVDSGWIEISNDVNNDDIYLAIIGSGGNGTVDPQLGNISVSLA